jgi:hypothetical protein
LIRNFIFPLIVIPKLRRLYNYLQYKALKKPTYKLNFAELVKWCKEKVGSKDDQDEGYLGAYQIQIDDDGVDQSHEFKAAIQDRQLRLFFTTKRLI